MLRRGDPNAQYLERDVPRTLIQLAFLHSCPTNSTEVFPNENPMRIPCSSRPRRPEQCPGRYIVGKGDGTRDRLHRRVVLPPAPPMWLLLATNGGQPVPFSLVEHAGDVESSRTVKVGQARLAAIAKETTTMPIGECRIGDCFFLRPFFSQCAKEPSC